MKIHILSQVQLYNDAIEIENNLKRNGHVVTNSTRKQSSTSILQKYTYMYISRIHQILSTKYKTNN